MSGFSTRDANRDDLPLITRVLERANRSGIDTLSPVVEEKVHGADARAEPSTIIAELDGDAVGFVTFSGNVIRLIGVDPQHQKRGVGSRLLEIAESRIGHRSRPIRVAGSAGNYLVPGVHIDDTETIDFFEHRGYQRDAEDATDLVVSLPLPEIDPLADKATIRRCSSEDRAATYRFIAREFAPGWAWEVDLGFRDGPPRCLLAIADGELIGFSGWELNNRGLGTFGPQGVVESARGLGVGKALLLRTLDALYEAGFEEARIPWVSSVEYYQRSCGARPAARYAQLSKKLSEAS